MRLSRLALTYLVLTSALVTPTLVGQYNVHAVLVTPPDRKPAPTFRLISESGKAVQLSDFRGKVVLLNFWATDCFGCKLEIPSFIELEEAYRDKGFTAIGISMAISYENLKNAGEAWGSVKPFVADHKLNYPILMGDDAISNSYNLNAYPATYLIDKYGRLAATYVGVVSKDDVETNIKTLLLER
jgi:peroxiredoxin